MPRKGEQSPAELLTGGYVGRVWNRRQLLRTGCLLATGSRAAAREIRNWVPTMKYRPLGRTGMVLSEVALGAHYDGPGWQQKQSKTPDRRRQIVNKAIELGINFFDVCTEEERRSLGQALRPYRDRVYMMTDLNALRGRRTATAEDFRQEFVSNLKTLQTEWVDLLRFNNNNAEDPVTFAQTELAYRVFEEFRAQGKARHFAVSGHDPDQRGCPEVRRK